MCLSPAVATRLPPDTRSHEAGPPSEARANTKDASARHVATHLLVAKGAHLHALDGPAL
jgi:hypothetical protein